MATIIKIFIQFESLVEKFTRYIALIGCLGMLFAIGITCLSIIGKMLRRGLNCFLGTDFNPNLFSWVRPILGEEEIVQLAIGFTLFAVLPWVTLQKGHIRINLLQQYFSAFINRLLNLIADISLSMIAYLIMTQQWYLIFKKNYPPRPSAFEHLLAGNWSQFIANIKMRDESQILSIPLWPFYGIAELCIILFFIVAIFGFCKSLLAFSSSKIYSPNPTT